MAMFSKTEIVVECKFTRRGRGFRAEETRGDGSKMDPVLQSTPGPTGCRSERANSVITESKQLAHPRSRR